MRDDDIIDWLTREYVYAEASSLTSRVNPTVYGGAQQPVAKLCQTSKSLEITYGR